MPRSFCIIDGYNLMHAAGMARATYGPGDLERCRNRFLRFLVAHLSVLERERTTVVFDAADAPPGAERTIRWEEMTVLFAERGGDADTLIEELIAGHSAPRQLVVVSTDRRLVQAARRRRAKTVTSEEFFEQLERRQETAATAEPRRSSNALPDEKLEGLTNAEETAEWSGLFGEVPEAEQLEQQDPEAKLREEVETWLRDFDETGELS